MCSGTVYPNIILNFYFGNINVVFRSEVLQVVRKVEFRGSDGANICREEEFKGSG